MYLNYLLIIQLFLQGLWVNGKKIWLIRHCDKPSKSESPCCSTYGYLRAESWGNYFESRVSKPLVYIASDYHPAKECSFVSYSLEGSSVSNCPKSQRMYITSQFIQQTLFKKGILGEINTHFCVGEESSLVRFLLGEKEEKGDVLIVWEHHGIVDILRRFGFRVSKWRNHLKEHYELVFWIDLDMDVWGYECYDFEKKAKNCSRTIVDWLGIREVGVGIREMSEMDLGVRIWMIVVLGFSVGCGMGVVAFLICRHVSSSPEELEGIFRKMPIYG